MGISAARAVQAQEFGFKLDQLTCQQPCITYTVPNSFLRRKRPMLAALTPIWSSVSCMHVCRTYRACMHRVLGSCTRMHCMSSVSHMHRILGSCTRTHVCRTNVRRQMCDKCAATNVRQMCDKCAATSPATSPATNVRQMCEKCAATSPASPPASLD